MKECWLATVYVYLNTRPGRWLKGIDGIEAPKIRPKFVREFVAVLNLGNKTTPVTTSTALLEALRSKSGKVPKGFSHWEELSRIAIFFTKLLPFFGSNFVKCMRLELNV
jgi:hypothetical protein